MSSAPQSSNTIGVKADPKILRFVECRLKIILPFFFSRWQLLIFSITRDPSALESISSALYGISSYVAYSLPTSLRKVASNSASDHSVYQHSINHHHEIDPQNHPMPPDGLFEKKKDVILYAAFDEIMSASSSKPNASVE
jgi:hypothetical protein